MQNPCDTNLTGSHKPAVGSEVISDLRRIVVSRKSGLAESTPTLPTPTIHCRWRTLCRVFTKLILVGVVLTNLRGGLFYPGKAFAQAPSGAMTQFQTNLIDTIERVEPSIVAVAVFLSRPEFPLAVDVDPFEALFSQAGAGRLPARLGAGVIIAHDPEAAEISVLTNAHLLEPAIAPQSNRADVQILVRARNRQTLKAQIHAADPRSDLAVLKVKLPPSLREANFPAVEIGQGETLRKGSLVLACGNPWGLARDGSCSVSFGMISNLGRSDFRGTDDVREQTLAEMGLLLEVDAQLDPGLSGGALLDLEGHLVGLISGLESGSAAGNSAVFALPCSPGVRRIIEELRQGYEVEYGFLGIHPETVSVDKFPASDALADHPTLAQIGRVAEGSPAEKAELEADDIILAVDETPVFRGTDVIRQTALLGPGAAPTLTVYRPGSARLLELRPQLGKWPVADASAMVTTAFRTPAWRGLRIDYPTARRRYLKGDFVSQTARGVLITAVAAESPASLAGLKVGEFIVKVGEQPVDTPAEFQAALEYWPGTVPVTLADDREVTIPEPTRRP